MSPCHKGCVIVSPSIIAVVTASFYYLRAAEWPLDVSPERPGSGLLAGSDEQTMQ
jgi:hypothetical protein